ncbi:hypothetical protein DFJ73DRAFT_532402 [Zopfochytrium polystomum]|nr:hypothetical protein DFJ73DRAFT_532402 [Zopfochytrium polystomum]
MRSDDETYEISSTGALRESSSVKPPLTKRAAEDLIHSFVRDGWLVNNAGYLSLSLRSVLELKSYLREEYDDQIRFCTLCKEIVTTHYQRCCLADCAGRLHLHCAKVYFESHPALCPVSSCHSPWRGESRRRLIAPERPIRPNRAASSIVDKLDDQDDQEDEEREKNSTPTGKGKGRPLESGSEPETGTEDVPLPSSSSGKRKRASRR